tara:strand:+ start:335 stop:616 length:282 start_codon:yes stop_codon:yes gene_type:complete
MENKDWLNLALAQMHQGQWFGWKKDWTGSERMSYENIIVNDSSITKPTESEVNTKIAELKQEVTDNETNKTSGKTKLKNLGLTDDEIKSLIGK